MTTTERPIAQNAAPYRVLGTRPLRHDGVDKVTGRAKYGVDASVPGMLYGAVLRSPHAHARILHIDTAAAEALPGVKGVVTAKDMGIYQRPLDYAQTMRNPRFIAEQMLASKKVVYKGQGVAAVAAASLHIAQEAAALIRVDYEPLPAVLSLDDAMQPNAPKVHDDLTTRVIAADHTRKQDSGTSSNVAGRLEMKRGDLAEGFRRAAFVAEAEFRTSRVHQGYIEPHNATAYWAPDGKITIWNSSQGAFTIREQVAEVLQVPESQVRIIPLEIGGGFGGKTTTYLDAVAALLSKKTGHPVKMLMTRREVFEATGPTPATLMRCKIGADKDGKLTAGYLFLAFDAGAFPGGAVGAGATTSFAPYKLDTVLVEGYDVVLNKPKVHSYRAPGSPQAAFAVESILDMLAAKLGLDPLELRRRNAAHEGDRLPNGVPLNSVGIDEVIAAMQKHPHYSAPLGGPNRGRGVSLGYWGNAGKHSSATLSLGADGKVSLVTGSVDIGGSRAALAMHAAEVLGLAAEDIVPAVGDTESVGMTDITGGSRTAMATGAAVYEAAQMIKREMIRRAALLWEVKPEDVSFDHGLFVNTRQPTDRLTFQQVAARAMSTGGPLTASASAFPKKIAPAICGNIVDVEVDPETGKVAVLRFTVVEDVGTAAHPSYVEGQMQGGTVQGIGWALSEEYCWNDSGAMLNPTFLDYRMPTSLDVPMIDTVMVHVPNPYHPFGVRGVGEVSIVPPLAALANAVSHAIGARMTSLPMSPAVVLQALAGKRA
ncbi:MAG: xanthine dehydrogenase family protein molybdopterin-binding subunit [Dehalococcoidia bacterium]|nr:xanthine dehydrogenase family protein molybdopterin-binding subunit [Dehalococcoidia bacterium]